MNKKAILLAAMLVTAVISLSGFIGQADDAEATMETSTAPQCLPVEPWWGICMAVVGACEDLLQICNAEVASS